MTCDGQCKDLIPEHNTVLKTERDFEQDETVFIEKTVFLSYRLVAPQTVCVFVLYAYFLHSPYNMWLDT